MDPFSTPTRRTTGDYSDRFIPSRERSLPEAFSLLSASPSAPPQAGKDHDEENEKLATYNAILRNELLQDVTGVSSRTTLSQLNTSPTPATTPPGQANNTGAVTPHGNNVGGAGVVAGTAPGTPGGASGAGSPVTPSLFQYSSPTKRRSEHSVTSPSGLLGGFDPRLVDSPRKTVRKISRTPFKVLDAPQLQDDFYLNLVDWSQQNILAVGLDTCVYLWSAYTSNVTKLCDVGANNSVTSVSWLRKGNQLAVGTNDGQVLLWDAATLTRTRTLSGHTARVGTLAASQHLLSSGSRDRLILQRDLRAPEQHVAKLSAHKQEVCGLKWSHNDLHLASGGNDNRLFVWNAGVTTPIIKYSEHTAAVKALAWSPHQHGLLASGGGTADRCIRIWNTSLAAGGETASSNVCTVDTGSQVCNLAWSKSVNELVSTHGYSQNQIVVWKYPSMTPLATLTGHSLRVLYLATSPDGQTIVTGAGDETLRFYNVWPQTKSNSSRQGSIFESALANIR